jgi:hypothetical protein
LVWQRGSNRRLEKLHNMEFYDLCSSQNIFRMIRSRKNGQGMWHVWGDKVNDKCKQDVCEETQIKGSLLKRRRRWEYNIKMDLGK